MCKTKGPADPPSDLMRLFLLVSVETKTLLTLVRSHLMSLMLFSVRHSIMSFELVQLLLDDE